jgi:hypothetical protein
VFSAESASWYVRHVTWWARHLSNQAPKWLQTATVKVYWPWYCPQSCKGGGVTVGRVQVGAVNKVGPCVGVGLAGIGTAKEEELGWASGVGW